MDDLLKELERASDLSGNITFLDASLGQLKGFERTLRQLWSRLRYLNRVKFVISTSRS